MKGNAKDPELLNRPIQDYDEPSFIFSDDMIQQQLKFSWKWARTPTLTIVRYLKIPWSRR